MKKTISVTICFVLLFCFCLSAKAGTSYKTCYEQSLDTLSRGSISGPVGTGSIGGDWLAFTLSRAGKAEKAYIENYKAAVKENIAKSIDEQGRLHRAKSTENSRLIAALSSIGIDCTDAFGYNLIKGLSDINYVSKQGVNGAIWALIALDCNSYTPVVGAGTTRDNLIDYILSKQLPDGGWALSGTVSDPDVTAMALTSLSPYYPQPSIRSSAELALNCLSSMQTAQGGFISYGVENSQSPAQVIVALCSLGINPLDDSRFIKNGNSVIDAMCSYYTGNGFSLSDKVTFNQMATEQCSYALNALIRLTEGRPALFNCREMFEAATPTGIKGDVDNDGKVTVSDARLCLRAAIYLENYETGSPEFISCDVDLSGTVTVGDARMILRKAIKLEDF